MDVYDRNTVERAYNSVMGEVFQRAGSPEAVALDLKRAGFTAPDGSAFSVQAMRAWRRGDNKPSPVQFLCLVARYGISIDQHLKGQALERSLADQLADHRQRIAALEDRLLHLAMLTGHDQDLEYATSTTSDAREALDRSLDDLAARRRRAEPSDA